MKYKNHLLRKINDSDIEWGYYYEIYYQGKLVTFAPNLSNAKEFVNSFNNESYDWNILC